MAVRSEGHGTSFSIEHRRIGLTKDLRERCSRVSTTGSRSAPRSIARGRNDIPRGTPRNEPGPALRLGRLANGHPQLRLRAEGAYSEVGHVLHVLQDMGQPDHAPPVRTIRTLVPARCNASPPHPSAGMRRNSPYLIQEASMITRDPCSCGCDCPAGCECAPPCDCAE